MEPEAIAVKLIGPGTCFHNENGPGRRTVLRFVIARDNLQLVHHFRRLGIIVSSLVDSAAAIASSPRNSVVDSVSGTPLSAIEVGVAKVLTGRGDHPRQQSHERSRRA